MSEKIEVYDIMELKEKFPDGFEYAFKKYQEQASNDELPWQREIMDSLKSTFKYAGVTLQDWEISDCSRSYVKFTIPTYWSELADCDMLVDDYEGKKAYNWLKESFDLKSYRRVNYKNYLGKKEHRYDFTKLKSEKDWDWSCEFTGVCFDHDFLESLFDDIHDGMNLKDAFHNLADVAGKLFSNEYEYLMSEECFIDESSCNDYQYSEGGLKIWK